MHIYVLIFVLKKLDAIQRQVQSGCLRMYSNMQALFYGISYTSYTYQWQQSKYIT